ncbi:MAG: 50S ribosomal protein L29 [Candidatus Zixiibacteriota bacterium]|nr:MAG: 50S ribosomal protein L29 [candidate division Zixibacteria bacterium]
MKPRALRELTRDELIQRQADLREELFNLKMRRSLKNLDNPLRLRTVRREIAKISTILREDTMGIRKLADVKGSILDAGEKAEK